MVDFNRRARATLAAVALAPVLGLTASACGGDASAENTTPRHVSTEPRPAGGELPWGGKTILPGNRIVAYYGDGYHKVLGILGSDDPQIVMAQLKEQAKAFQKDGENPVRTAIELIVTIADAHPGDGGNYSHPVTPDRVKNWLDIARQHDMILILDIQPGQAEFLPEVKRWEEFLREPDVSLALDPEWRMRPGEVPGEVIGRVKASEVNEVSSWLSDLVSENDLPQKLLLLHEFRVFNVGPKAEVKTDEPGVAVVWHVDGFGSRADKITTWEALNLPDQFMGFKLFYRQDRDIFQPEELWDLDPVPVFYSYQ